MGRIQVLPDSVINQIAAGEVVERPASVVKELVENALDAGATRLSITVEDGGKALVSVLDNGAGMDEDDARLAIQRHATSKIREEAELGRIATLGFRGEALASIAAVSRFELTTCADERAGGVRVAVEGGQVRSVGRVGFPRGTKVVVESLFCNTPARRKFLRATQTEFQHLQTVVAQIALAHPAVQFRLTHNQRPVYDLPRCETLAERAFQLFGRELAEGMLPVAGEEGAFRFEGLLSHPSHSKGSRRWQYLFVNGRPIRNAGINHAVYQGFRTLLMKERHPAYVLMLSLHPEEVDVNVHPAKSEVRLRNPQLIHTVLSRQLHQQLMAATREEALGAQAVPQRARQAGLGFFAGGAESVPEAPAWASVRDAPAGDALLEAARATMPLPSSGTEASAEPVPDTGAPAGLRLNPYGGEDFHFQPLSGPRPAEAEPSLVAGGQMTVLCQFHNTYLLAQRGDALVVIDQHAAHERIRFEQYRTQFYEGRLVTEDYLVPLTLELSPQNALLLEQYLPQWERMGFGMEPFGRNSFLVRRVPALIAGKDIAALVLEVLDELALFGKSGRLEEVFNEILERVACHSAIRAGMRLSREEMEALVGQLEGLDINVYCPHGRPVWVEYPLRELEKRFKRIV